MKESESHSDINSELHSDSSSLYTRDLRISLVAFFHAYLVHGRAAERVERDGRAKSSSKQDHECKRLVGEGSANLSSSTVRARESGARLSVANIKFNFLPARHIFIGSVPSRLLRATAGHLVGSPWMVLSIFLCARSSINNSDLEITHSSDPNSMMGRQIVV